MAAPRRAIHLAPCLQCHPVGKEDQRTSTRQAWGLLCQYLEVCRQDQDYHLTLADWACLGPFLAVFGEQREFLRELAATGRLHIGGSYHQPHELNLQGEAIVRNLLYGRSYRDNLLNTSLDVYLSLAGCGHCLQLPQIAAKSGFEAMVWSPAPEGVPSLYLALAPDGSRLLQRHENLLCQPGSMQELLASATEGFQRQAELGLSQGLQLLADDTGAPVAWLQGRSEELAESDPPLLLSTPHHFWAEVKPEVESGRARIPSVGRDFSCYHLGTAVSRSDLKIANRLAENRLLEAEKWATLAALLGARYPDLALDKAWRQLLFGQHPEAIGGTSNDLSFLDLLAGYREALELASEVEERSLAYVARKIETGKARGARPEGMALVVFNPLGWERTDICRARVELSGALTAGFKLADDRGREVAAQVIAGSAQEGWVEIGFVAAGVPSIGYRTYYLRPAKEMPPTAVAATPVESVIENEHFALRADAAAGGGLTSIYDKVARREVLNPKLAPANEVIALAEEPERERAAWELCTTGGMVGARERPAQVSALRGPVFTQLRIEAELPGRCGLRQEVTLYQGLPRIGLRTALEGYRGEHELLALSFPLSLQGTPTFEDRFAAAVRMPSHGTLDFRTSEAQNLSRCGLGWAQNWVEVGPAPSLLVMEGTRPVGAFPLGPCAIIAASDPKAQMALRVLEEALLQRGITCTPWLDTDDPERDVAACAFRISLGRSNAYSLRLLGSVPAAAERLDKMLATRPWAAVLVRSPDATDDWPALPVLVADTADPGGLPRLADLLAAAMEANELQLPASCEFSGLARPVADYGMALINRGTPAASLERDGRLVGLLFHTAAWSANPWGKGKLAPFFVPEHKSHVFEHALLPHAGDWRRAGLVRAGLEFNHPLRAVQTPLQPGALPSSFSLVSVDPPNLIITAVKPLGNPVVDRLAEQQPAPGRGIMVRMYEAHGESATAHISFGLEPKEVWLTDLMERKAGEVETARARRPALARRRAVATAQVPITAGPGSIITLGARLTLPAQGEPGELGPSTEPYAPIYCRYWDHNLGAAPMGDQPVTLWLRGSLPVGKNTRFTLGLSNDYRDREIAGRVQLSAPPEWPLIPREVPYRIAPGSQAIYEIMVVVPADAPSCFLRALAEDNGRRLQDVLAIGEIAPLAVALRWEGDGFVVDLGNPNSDFVEGEVALITPVESWGRSVGSLALAAASPRLHAFRLGAGQEQRFRFAVQGEREGLWAVAKVMWYGQVQYAQEAR